MLHWHLTFILGYTPKNHLAVFTIFYGCSICCNNTYQEYSWCPLLLNVFIDTYKGCSTSLWDWWFCHGRLEAWQRAVMLG